MINNLELIKPLLTFDDKDDFYMLYIFKRKKDQPEEDRNNHQSVRTIKTYCISSIEYLEEKWDEITHLCEYFKARAYIHIQGQNHKDISLNMMVELADRIRSGSVDQRNLFDSVVGQIKTKEKRWIVDIDSKEEEDLLEVITGIEDCEPISYKDYKVEYKGTFYPAKEIISKIIEIIPTKNGYHLITKPFNVEQFRTAGFNEDIQKKNPTLLYLPNSLD